MKLLFPATVMILGAALGGCRVAPAYHPPAPPTPLAPVYKEMPAGGGWQVASPHDAMLRGPWWEIFGDPELNALEARLDLDNQNLAQDFQNYMEARALVAEARSRLKPVVTIGAGVSRSGPARAGAGNDLWTVPIDASWQPDLWGTIREQVRAAQFGAQAGAALLATEKLSEESALAEYFFEIRGQDALQVLLDQTVANDGETLQLTRSRYQAGMDDQASVLQAAAQLQSDQSLAVAVGLARAQYEHAMAVLVGAVATDFTIPVRSAVYRPPAIPVGVPSALLERRPDVATAERTLAQANAIIGVGYGAFYPQITLSASAGLQSQALKQLFDAASRMWSVGPSLSETLYNAGLYRAQLQQYTATYDADVAAYRQTVLVAFQQVEDGLAAVRISVDKVSRQQLVVASAQAALDLELSRYRSGLDPYLDVLVSQAALVQARQTLLAAQVDAMTYAVELVQALGGGWDQTQLPPPA